MRRIKDLMSAERIWKTAPRFKITQSHGKLFAD